MPDAAGYNLVQMKEIWAAAGSAGESRRMLVHLHHLITESAACPLAFPPGCLLAWVRAAPSEAPTIGELALIVP